jgi:hypothetical protein
MSKYNVRWGGVTDLPCSGLNAITDGPALK